MVGARFTVSVTAGSDDPEWDRFVRAAPGGNHLQTTLWARVKASLGWKACRVRLLDGETIAAGAQILLRPATPLASMGYVTKAPLCRENDPELARQVIMAIHGLRRKLRLQYLIVQPANNGACVTALLPGLGFRETSIEAAPVASILVDTTLDLDTLLANMKRQMRQNVRRSEREGVSVREGTREDLELFYTCYQKTSVRQGFLPYEKAYFYTLWDILAPTGNIGLILAEKDGECVSGLLIVPYGEAVIAKLFGWTGKYPESRPNEGVFWGAICWAREHGYHYFDFEGIDPRGASAYLAGEPLPEELLKSPTFMKLQFGGQVLCLPKAYEYIYNPLLRWGYYQVAPRLMRAGAFEKLLDRVRKRSAGG